MYLVTFGQSYTKSKTKNAASSMQLLVFSSESLQGARICFVNVNLEPLSHAIALTLLTFPLL